MIGKWEMVMFIQNQINMNAGSNSAFVAVTKKYKDHRKLASSSTTYTLH